MIQWLSLWASNAGDKNLILSWGTETCPSGVVKIFKIKKKETKQNFIRFPRYLLQFAINLKGSVVYLVESSWKNISKSCELHTQSSLLGSSLE